MCSMTKVQEVPTELKRHVHHGEGQLSYCVLEETELSLGEKSVLQMNHSCNASTMNESNQVKKNLDFVISIGGTPELTMEKSSSTARRAGGNMRDNGSRLTMKEVKLLWLVLLNVSHRVF